MHAVIRNWTGAPKLGHELKSHVTAIEAEISAVPGFIAYYMLETQDGIASVTVCESREGCEESTKRAGNWLRANLPNVTVGAPTVIGGDLVMQFANNKTKV
jgi:hypothetical protein